MSTKARSRHVLLVLAGILLAFPSGPARSQGTQEVGPPAKQKGEDRAPAAGELYPGGRAQISTVGLGAVVAGVQCDIKGNMYLIRAESPQVIMSLPHNHSSLPVTKLSPDSRSLLEFPVGAFSDYADYYREAFYVASGGTVYGLVVATHHPLDYKGPNRPDSLVVKYKDNGTVDSVLKLEPPQGVFMSPFHFAAFMDGNFLVTGYLLSDEPQPLPTEPFTYIFDRGGAFVASLTMPQDVDAKQEKPADHSQNSNALPIEKGAGTDRGDQGRAPQRPAHHWSFEVVQGLVVGSLDGSIYLVRASNPARVYTISSAGTVLRDVDVKPPAPGLRPLQASVAGQNGLLVEFAHVADRADPNTGRVLALVDPGSGKITATYALPPKAGVPGCAKSEREFLFLNENEKGQLEVATFVPR